MTSILAGLMIGIGDIALLSVENKVVGAFLFSVALMSIVCLKMPLYTGRIGKVIEKRNPFECMVILLMNCVGVGLALWSLMIFNPELVSRLDSVSASKFSKSYLALFVAGILCNILIHIAVVSRNAVIIVLCVMAFILSGFEHSIADFMYALADGNLLKWLMIVLGNSVGGIGTELMLRKGWGLK